MIGKLFLAGLVAREGVMALQQIYDRQKIFRQARTYADRVNKPLLVVGTPKWGLYHPCGDVTIDIGPGWGQACDVEIADVRDIPYPSEYFGAAYVSHVLEHLPTIEDAFIALDELERVADKVFTVSPGKGMIVNWAYPGHYLWVTPSGDGYVIEQRRMPGKKEEAYYQYGGIW